MSFESSFHAEVAAALDGVAAHLDSSSRGDVAALAVERTGDALRLGIALPPVVARWLGVSHGDALTDAVQHARSELQAWPPPGARPSEGEPDDILGCAVRARDRAQSILVGLRRACIARDWGTDRVPGLADLRREMSEFDASLRSSTSRSVIVDALADRLVLLRDDDWTAPFADDASQPGMELAVDSAALTAASPPDWALVEYVTRGRWRRWVETAARNLGAFRTDLLRTIDDLASSDTPVSLVALRFRTGSTKSSLALPVPKLAVAAAPSEHEEAARPEATALGVLDPVEAEAELVALPGRLRLRVFAPPGSLRSVRMLDREVTTESSPGEWIAEAPFPDDAVEIRVEDASGRVFEERVHLVRDGAARA